MSKMESGNLDDKLLLTGSTSRLLDNFIANGLACEVLDGRLNLIKYQTKDGNWRLLRGMLSEKLPLFSLQICDDKLWTYSLFKELGRPTPETLELASDNLPKDFMSRYQSVVVKPRSGAHGHGVSMNITSEPALLTAIERAKVFDKNVLIQQQVVGTDIRLLVVGGKVVSALERRPAHVKGDGVHTVSELIRLENEKSERGKLGIDTLVEISMAAVNQFLTKSQLSSMPAAGDVVRVVGPSNQSMGGSVHDITNNLPEAVRGYAELLSEHLQLPIAGIDCILTSDGYYFLEINASPGIAIHDDPALGIESGCFKTYMNLLHQDTWWRNA